MGKGKKDYGFFYVFPIKVKTPVFFWFWRFYFFTFHGSKYLTVLFVTFVRCYFLLFSFLFLLNFFFFNFFWVQIFYCLTCLPFYCFTLLGFCYFVFVHFYYQNRQSSCPQGFCSSVYKNMHLVLLRCMCLKLCAHSINGNTCIFAGFCNMLCRISQRAEFTT